jgi:hypothetical protein
MYGCRPPEGVDWFGDDPELVFEFQTAIGWRYESDFRPVSIEGVDDVPVLGVLVAVSGSGENGAADLWPTRRFADIASLAETSKARETWERFVAWCKERQIELPAAELWIVTTETA